MIAAGLIGYGYWGPNLLRNLQGSGRFEVVAVAEPDNARREAAQRAAPGIAGHADARELLERPDVAAVLIATPVATHYPLARQAIENGKHVLVEKPLCRSAAQCEELIAFAAANRRLLMVDHTFLFTGAVRKLHELVSTGSLGRISYYDSLRVNLGLFQPDVNVLWDLAPHDFSILDHVIGAKPVHVEATGYCHLKPGVPDICYVTMHCEGGFIAHFNLSWMSPAKVRRIAIGGDRRMVVWDDLDREEKIRVYDSGVRLRPEDERLAVTPEYRIGDIHSPRIANVEALAGVVRHFADVIEGRDRPIMGGEHGLHVVQMLEAAQASLDASLARVAGAREAARPPDIIGRMERDPTLRIAPDVKLGKNVQFAGFANLYGCEIGDESRIGPFVEIQKGVRIGRRVKIQSHTFVCEGVHIEDEAFVGHGVMFINDRFPRATRDDSALKGDGDWTCEPTFIERRASIGSNATILCGVRIGAESVIGAGSVVTQDVPARAIVAGNPARVLRYVDER